MCLIITIQNLILAEQSFIIAIMIVGMTKINSFCSLLEKIKEIIHPNSEFRSILGLEIAGEKNHNKTEPILKCISRFNRRLKIKLIMNAQLEVSSKCNRCLHDISSSFMEAK